MIDGLQTQEERSCLVVVLSSCPKSIASALPASPSLCETREPVDVLVKATFSLQVYCHYGTCFFFFTMIFFIISNNERHKSVQFDIK